jgi:regulator of vacuolar morphogenesis
MEEDFEEDERRHNDTSGANDHDFGQRGAAFPGLEDSNEDQLFYGPATDGLEYLQMVRYDP